MGKKRIFLTGAAGSLGASLRSRLRARYDFRLLLHATVPDDVHPEDQVVVGSVADDAAMVEAGSGVDAIVHLAIRRWRGMTPGRRGEGDLRSRHSGRVQCPRGCAH